MGPLPLASAAEQGSCLSMTVNAYNVKVNTARSGKGVSYIWVKVLVTLSYNWIMSPYKTDYSIVRFIYWLFPSLHA